VEHPLERRLGGQRSRRQAGKVVGAEQIGLDAAGDRVANVVDQLVEEAGEQPGKDL
jgi:hypothetical protein